MHNSYKSQATVSVFVAFHVPLESAVFSLTTLLMSQALERPHSPSLQPGVLFLST